MVYLIIYFVWFVSPIWGLDQFKYLSWYFPSLYNALIWFIRYLSPVWIRITIPQFYELLFRNSVFMVVVDQFKYLSWYFTSLYNALIWFIRYISPVWVRDQFRNQFCLYGLFLQYGFQTSLNTYPGNRLVLFIYNNIASLLRLSCLRSSRGYMVSHPQLFRWECVCSDIWYLLRVFLFTLLPLLLSS